MSSGIHRKLSNEANEFSKPSGSDTQVQESCPRTEVEIRYNDVAISVSENGSRFQKLPDLHSSEFLSGQSTESLKAVQISPQNSNLVLSEFSTRILVVGQSHENREYIVKMIRNMKLLQKVEISSCGVDDAMQLCKRVKYCLVFLEISSSGHNESYRTLCSSLRINNESLNHTVPLIALLPEVTTQELVIPEAINDTIQLPLTEQSVNQQLLKWVGKSTYTEMPLTPNCPEDDVALAKKAAQIIKETEEQGLLRDQHSTADRVNLYETKQQFVAASNNRTQSDDVMAFTECSFPTHELRGPNSSQAPQGFMVKCYPAAANTKIRDHSGELAPSQEVLNRHSNEKVGTVYQDLHQPRMIGIRPRQERVVIQGVPSQGFNAPSMHQFSGHGQSVNALPNTQMPAPIIHQNQQTLMQNQHFLPQNHFGAQHQRVLSVNYGNQALNQSVRPQPLGIHAVSYNTGEPHYNSVPCWTQFPTPPPEPRLAAHPAALDSWGNRPQSCDSFQASGNLQKPASQLGSPAYMVSGTPGSKDMKITMIQDDLTKHSSKERLRRERIKESCDQLRLLLPSLSGTKTDMASILEMTVKYIQLVNQRLPPALKLEIANAFCPERKQPRKKRLSQQYEVISAKKKLFSDGSPQGHLGQVRPIFSKDPCYPFGMNAPRPTMVNAPSPVFPNQKLYPGVCFSASATHSDPQFQPVSRSIPAAVPLDPSNRITANHSNERSSIFYPQPLVNQENSSASTTGQLHCVPAMPSCTRTNQEFETSDKNSEEMPSQWGFLRLPPISTISPSSTTSNLSRGDSVSDLPSSSSSSCSERATPDNTAATPPAICTNESGHHSST